MPFFVLVHSPSVGPATWLPVARRLRELGHGVAVPSLLGVAEGEPPYWPRVVAAVAAGLADTEPDEPLVLVAHSNAGVFVPVIVAELSRPVACSVFADAAIPGPGDDTPMVPDDLLPFLRGLTGADGRLPPWTDWWDERDVAPMFPSAEVRQAIAAEQPRLPLAYYLEQVPVPRGWDDGHRCAYLLFSQAYADLLTEARRRGWPTLSVPGEHLHQVVDAEAVTQAILDLTAAAGWSSARASRANDVPRQVRCDPRLLPTSYGHVNTRFKAFVLYKMRAKSRARRVGRRQRDGEPAGRGASGTGSQRDGEPAGRGASGTGSAGGGRRRTARRGRDRGRRGKRRQ